MSERYILITAPSLDTRFNVSGISSVTNFIIGANKAQNYKHFELGRKDDEKRNIMWLLRMIKTAFRWMVSVSSKKVQQVHFNFALSKASILRDAPLVIFAKLARKKMVIHVHGGDYLTNSNTPKWIQWILKRLFAGKTAVIVLSPVEKKIIEERYKVKNIKVLPNCVDLTDAKLFNRSYVKDQVVKLLFIGRISQAKGLAHIYSILSGLKKNEMPFKFFLAGTGADEKEYVGKFTNLLGKDFEFKGVVSGNTKTALYKNSDIFLLPSLFEGLPMSLLEAMSFGLVPVVTNVGSMGFVVTNNENGIITALNDNTASVMEAAITQLINNNELQQQLSVNAATFIYKNYSPEDYVTQLNKIYAAA